MRRGLSLVVGIILSLFLTKILYAGQKYAQSHEKPPCRWIHILFWIGWIFIFLLYLCIFGLLLLVGAESCKEGDTLGAVKLFAVALLLALGIYRYFLYPIIKKLRK